MSILFSGEYSEYPSWYAHSGIKSQQYQVLSESLKNYKSGVLPSPEVVGCFNHFFSKREPIEVLQWLRRPKRDPA